jgi:para-aminobenzoate synthetase
VRIVLVDNHDSYTFNLAGLLEAAGATVTVLAHDDPALLALERGDLDALVISPGPGSPLIAADVGHTPALLERLVGLPVLGVCLGHQLLAALAGAEVVAAEPAHGQVERVRHDGSALFDGVPTPFSATRYHSLAVRPGGTVRATAWAEDGTVMAMAVRDRPWWGVQFHPESVASEAGERLVRNFLALVRPEVRTREVGGRFDRAVVFRSLYADAPASFWLDGPVGLLGAASEVVAPSGEAAWAWLRSLPTGGSEPLPGGWIGWIGYEGETRWMRADRVLVHDAVTGGIELRATGPGASTWLEETAAALEGLRDVRPEPLGGETGVGRASQELPEPRSTPVSEYVAAIATCKEHLARGESYELCLTRQLHLPPVADPLALFEALRTLSPTDRAAYLRTGELAIASATPEEFVSVTAEGVVRARPIKGTARRSADPVEDAALAAGLAADPKTRAENLMIVDLLRNDLHRVCEPGSVAVPGYLEVESYAGLHQLVSTVTGRLRPGLSAIDAVRSCFPPGSMTGAPKERTVRLLAALEPEPRGVYSGALGVVGADGSVDLSVVIRTAVCTPAEVSVGVGGAIVWGSDPEAEWEETELKARAVLAAWAQAASPGTGSGRTPPSRL